MRAAAHISVLLDVFPAEGLSIAEKPLVTMALFGLIQDFDTEFIDDDSGFSTMGAAGTGRTI